MGNFSTKLVSAASMATLVVTAMGASITSAASEFLPYAETLANHGVINAQSTEAGYRLGDNITRAELAKVAANLGQYPSVACTGKVYSDVGPALGDLCDAIETLAAANVVTKANATFRPSANVTRAEMTKMLLGALGESPSSTSAGYADVSSALGDLEGFINRANEIGAVMSATYFRPNATGSRGEVFKIAATAAKLNTTTPTPNPNPTPGSGSTSTGNVAVALEGSATAQYVPMNASSVNVGNFKVTATGGPVTISSVTIGRSGLGNSQNVTISLAQAGNRVSESRTVNTSSQESVVRLNTPVTLTAGQSVVFSTLVSVNGQANAQHQFAVKAVNGAAIAPVTLGLINTTSYTTSIVTVDQVALRSVTSGRNDQNFATVTLRAGNQDATISGFTLTKSSGVDLTRALANVSVYKNNVKVGTAAVTSDKIVVTGLATDLARNNSATYDLRADVIYVGDGNANDDITLNIAETEDVVATEKSTGFTTQVVTLANPSGTVDLSSLDITLTKKTNTNLTVAPGATNVLLLDGTIAASASFDVTKFTLANPTYPAGATASSVFSSLTLTVNGVDYDLIDVNNAMVTMPKVFQATGDKFRIDAGTPVAVQLRATLLNNATPGNVRFNLELNQTKNLNTGNTTNIAGKVLNGDTFTIQAPTLTIRQSTVSAPTASKIFSNATDLEIGRFGVEAKADEVSVRKIVVTNVAGTKITNLNDVVNNVRLINVADGSTVASSAIINNTTLEFNSVNLRVAKNTVVNVKVVADTLSDLTTTQPAKEFLAQVTIANSDVSSASSAAATVTANIVTPDAAKVYTISTQPPSVKVTPVALDGGAIARVVVTNKDLDKDMHLNSAKVRLAYRYTGQGTAPTLSSFCLRNVGSSANCGDAGTLNGTVNGDVVDFTISGSTLTAAGLISKSNGTAEFEVYLNNAPVWVAGDNVRVDVRELGYTPDGLTATTESYVGVADASATATK